MSDNKLFISMWLERDTSASLVHQRREINKNAGFGFLVIYLLVFLRASQGNHTTLNKGRSKYFGRQATPKKVAQSILEDQQRRKMDGYSSSLRSITQGRAKFKMSFLAYEAVPFELQRKLVDDYSKTAKEEFA